MKFLAILILSILPIVAQEAEQKKEKSVEELKEEILQLKARVIVLEFDLHKYKAQEALNSINEELGKLKKPKEEKK